MTADQYKQKLARAEELCALDPEASSDEGQELIALACELEEYERVHFPMMDTRTLIENFRGGVPGKCDFCGRSMPPGQLEPEEAGDWACWKCLYKWAMEDDNIREAAFWERCIKEAEAQTTRGVS